MIDIHSHVLNEVDDGSNSFEESIVLLQQAKSEGITDIICTPHYMKFGRHRTAKSVIFEKFEYLKQYAKKEMGINLYLGNEILLNNYKLMDYIENDLIYTLNNSRYLLFEMPFRDYQKDIFDEVYDVCVSGYRPILAHPERYLHLQKHPELIYNLVKEGCLMQVNQDSFFGKYGKEAKETAILLLKHKLVHFIASDGHSINRPVTMKESYEFVSKFIDDEYREDLYVNNGRKVLNNEIIKSYAGIKIEDKKYLGGLFKRKK